MSGVFTDADGDTLSLVAISADSSIVDAMLDGKQLTLTAVSLGTTNVTVTASDSRGGTASKTIAVEVRPNRAPVVKQTIAGQIVQPDKDIEVDLAGVYDDPDEDDLTYAAVSSDTALASVSVAGDRLTVSGIADGTATITVTATDVVGNKIDTSFQVDVSSNEAPKSSVPFRNKWSCRDSRHKSRLTRCSKTATAIR